MSPTLTNTHLQALGITAADLSLGLCPQAVAHLERCALAATVKGPDTGGAGRVHRCSESDSDGAGKGSGSPEPLLYAATGTR